MAKTNEIIELYQGDTKDLEVYVVDGDGAKVNLSGASIEWVLFKTINGSTLVTKTTVDGITLNAPEGIFLVHLNPSDTESLLGKYEYQAEVVDIRGYKTMAMDGSIEIKQRKK